MTGATSEAGTPGFSGVHVTRSLVLCVCFVDRRLSFCTFSFAIVLSVLLQYTDSDSPLISSNSSCSYFLQTSHIVSPSEFFVQGDSDSQIGKLFQTFTSFNRFFGFQFWNYLEVGFIGRRNIISPKFLYLHIY